MKLISHRGNISCIHLDRENSPEYIDEAIGAGYDVEIDVRIKDGLIYLGHDEAQYYIESYDWLIKREKSLWIHCKDFESLSMLIDKGLRVFFHEKEKHTIINNTNLIWSHNFQQNDNKNCIIPLISLEDINSNLEQCYCENKCLSATVLSAYGICSDYVNIIKEML